MSVRDQFIEIAEREGLRLYADGGDYRGRAGYVGPAILADDPAHVASLMPFPLVRDHMGKGFVLYPR